MEEEGVKPLCIDLFCGLRKAKLFRSAYPFVEKLVAGRAKNPDHVTLGVFHFAPDAFPLKSGLVRELNDPRLSTRLARLREIRILSADSDYHSGIFEAAPGIVDRLDSWVPFVKSVAAVLCGRYGARFRAIAAIAVGRHDVEVCATNLAVPSCFRDVRLFFASKPSRPRLTPERAIQFIDSAGRELRATYTAE